MATEVEWCSVKVTVSRASHLLQVAKEAAASRKRSGDALSYAVALAAVISVESPFVHIDGIMVRLQPLQTTWAISCLTGEMGWTHESVYCSLTALSWHAGEGGGE